MSGMWQTHMVRAHFALYLSCQTVLLLHQAPLKQGSWLLTHFWLLLGHTLATLKPSVAPHQLENLIS